MRSSMYPRLALGNIRKNGQVYVPYILTGVCTTAMFYILSALSVNTGLSSTFGGTSLKGMLQLGCFVIAIFATIFLLYTNSFLIKRRKKELGLYNILGMEKRHIARMLALETVLTALVSIAGGLLLGVLLNRLSYMALLKAMHTSIKLRFEIQAMPFLYTAALFCAIYALALVKNLASVRLANPIELLHGGNVGEKEPRTKWVLALLGAITLGFGYYISITTVNPIKALLLFFVAVVLVIIGTYCLFTAGSVAALKLLRRNKAFYYAPRHFTTVSGMLYRMKQNAVGLASICILSTMVLVTVSSTACLYGGVENLIASRYPRQIQLMGDLGATDDTLEKTLRTIDAALADEGDARENTSAYRFIKFAAVVDGDNFITDRDNYVMDRDDKALYLCFLPAEDYAQSMGQTLTLAPDEAAVITRGAPYAYDTLTVLGETFRVKAVPDDFAARGLDNADIAETYYVVVRDMDIVRRVAKEQAEAYGDNCSELALYAGFDVRGDEKKALESLCHAFAETGSMIESRAENRPQFYGVYGGLCFIGVFLGLAFLLATVLIIYYKQVSEGYDDRGRYEIMSKVGMSQAEIRASINDQIRTVFFLPLITACVHTAFAFPVVSRILALMNMNATTHFIWYDVCVALVFAVFYAIVYALTARTYYRIVR